MRVENGMVVLERKDCHWCDHGTRPGKNWVVCPKCHGTGKRGNGRCRNCNDRNGYYGSDGRRPGYVIAYDHENRVPCERCGGNWQGFDEENYTDHIDVTFLPIEVMRANRRQSWAEQNLGMGVYTIVDYGRHKNQTDEELIEKVRNDLDHVQACKVVRSKDDLTLCEKIVIVTGDMGFSALPVFADGSVRVHA